MAYRHVTPPPTFGVDDYDHLQCPSGSSRTSLYPNDWSPATALTAGTTPPKSPLSYPYPEPSSGLSLQPQSRPQDHLLDPPSLRYSHLGHTRTTSLPAKCYQTAQFGGALPVKGNSQRRSISPYTDGYMVPAPYEYMTVPATVHRRSPGSSSAGDSLPTHTRNTSSSSSIDASLLTRYGYPTYRQAPTPQTVIVTPRPTHAMSHLAPMSMSRGNIQSHPVQPRTASPPLKQHRASVKIEIMEDDDDAATSTVLDYLTSPSPVPSLIYRAVETNKNLNTHFWFDIRNLRPWSDFTIETITSIPNLLNLLKIDIPAYRLPIPSRVNLELESTSQLADLIAHRHAVKVNAALRIALGERHIAMRNLTSAPGARQQPEFVANYHSDAEKTIFGDGRGRVIGIVKAHEQWNSGMRTGSAIDKVKYLRHLAHLHRFMREHGTRYGFLVTEIELVCVRAGGPPTSDGVPIFGHIEVAAPVSIAAACVPGRLTMTADLALWYLHMLAKEQPFPGQFHWRLDVGAPAQLTRRRHEPRDEWMPKPTVSEKREAKRIRGWLWPDEPLSKRECGRGKRTRA